MKERNILSLKEEKSLSSINTFGMKLDPVAKEFLKQIGRKKWECLDTLSKKRILIMMQLYGVLDACDVSDLLFSKNDLFIVCSSILQNQQKTMG